MTFDEILAHVVDLPQRQGRVSYGALKRRFALDDDYLDDLKSEIIKAQRLTVNEDGEVLVWTGNVVGSPAPATEPVHASHIDTPAYLDEKIPSSQSALVADCKQVTVLIADLKGSLELLTYRMEQLAPVGICGAGTDPRRGATGGTHRPARALGAGLSIGGMQ